MSRQMRTKMSCELLRFGICVSHWYLSSSKGTAGSAILATDRTNKKYNSSSNSAFVSRVSSTPPRGSADEAGSLKEFIVPDGVENIEWDTTDDDDIDGEISSDGGDPNGKSRTVEDPNNPTPHRYVIEVDVLIRSLTSW